MYGRVLGIPYRLWKVTVDIGIQVARRLSNPNKNSIPVFLVGCGRSGTSMVLRSLGKSYKVEIYNETHSSAFERFRLKDFGIIEQLNNVGYAKIKLYKPILDTHMAVEYLSGFPSAKIIFMYRHYSDVISSSIRYFGVDNWPSRVVRWIDNDFEEFASAPPPNETKHRIRSLWANRLSAESSIALYWLFYNRLYIDLGLNQNPNVILINYENIVTRSDVEFHNLCRFLGVEYSQNMSKGMFATSIKHNSVRNLDETIKIECENLWDYLGHQVRNTGSALYDS
ncbi:MAG: sulfotransferase [Anaerolineae bacterium]|nr:sulfotransferase [Anaerolineae bacterium]